MSNYWVGVIIGACTATVLFIALMFSVVRQNQELKNQIRVEIQAVEAKVAEHEKILNDSYIRGAYEFYRWNDGN